MKTATLYKTDGSVETITPANGKDFKLEEMRAAVGGTVDIQHLPKTKEIMILNDSGKLDGLPINGLATEVWKKAYPIAEYPHNNDELVVGNVIVCDSSMVK